jgi:outer membrane protein OmpA-like peptidoglycan-associated protein
MVKNNFTDKLQRVLVVFAIALFLNACAHRNPPKEYRNDQKMGLEEAITALGQNLKVQLGKSLRNKKGETQFVVIDPILSIESGQQFKANQQVVSILSRELGSGYQIDEISPETLAKAKYVIAGALSQRGDLAKDAQSNCELVITILELPTGVVKAKGQVNIRSFPFEPLAFYEDSPIFLYDKSGRLAKSLFGCSIGQPVGREYLQFLPAKASIQQGIFLYEREQYSEAATAFSKAVTDTNGKTLTSNAGQYLTAQKLNREDDANRAFADLLTIAIEENRRLDIRFLFNVNSPTFIPNPELAKRYAWWLKQIAIHMQKSNYCLAISGHSSRSGVITYNERLSLARAKTVQGVLAVTYPDIIKKSRIEGRGFKENIVGSGTDDVSDALDRRVEFSIIDCSELPRLNAK